MKYTATIEGKSLVFNIAFVVVNLTGLGFFVSGSLNSNDLFFYLGIALMVLSTAGMIVFKGRLMMSSVARVLVGGLFIVSGLVKANDPLGFSYKLEEYFQDGALAYRIKELFGAPAFSLEFLMDYALVISVIICIIEIVLGVLTIIGGKIKLVSYLMLGMMLFFTFLTWHTANCDDEATFLDRDTYAISSQQATKKLEEAKEGKVKIFLRSSTELVVDEMKIPQCVTDCGCFGDALKGSVGRSLTPFESLWKDLILLYLVMWIFVAQWIIKPNSLQQNLVFTVTSSLVVLFFAWVFGWYFPIFFGVIAILGALWIKRIGGKRIGNYWGSALFVAILSFLVVGFVLRYAPLKDYRPYAIGSDLKAKLNDGEPEVSQRVMLYRNTKTGEERTYLDTSDEYNNSNIWEDTDWKFIQWEEKVLKEEIPASIQDFFPSINSKYLTEAELKLDFVSDKGVSKKVERIHLQSNEEEESITVLLSEFKQEDYPSDKYTIVDTVETIEAEAVDISVREDLFSQNRIAILVSRDLKSANWNEMDRIKAIAEQCEKEKVPFVMITSGTREEIDAFREKNSFNCAVFSMDQIELKIISRSNPALLVLEKGVVIEKYSHRMIPTGDRFKEKHLNN